MPDERDSEQLFYINGIDVTTGAFFDPAMPDEQILGLVRQRRVERWQQADIDSRESQGEAKLGVAPGVRADDLKKAGWCILFPQQVDARVRAAMEPLIRHRRESAGDLCRVFEGETGYRTGETWEGFHARNGIQAGLARPKEMPYYVLIVGDPESIPFSFQFDIDIIRAVGRIYFDTPEEYTRYVDNILRAEGAGGPCASQRPRRAALVSVDNDDPATQLSCTELIPPLCENLAGELAGEWDIQLVEREQASKERLGALLGGPETPALLFSASHGAVIPPGQDPQRQLRQQGALICSDWSFGSGPVPDSAIFSAGDVSSSADLTGMIAMFFACFSGGTPRENTFSHLRTGNPPKPAPQYLAEKSFLAQLPMRMLAHPKGALAVISHVDRVFPTSFLNLGLSGKERQDYGAIGDTLKSLMLGDPVGLAMEAISARYAEKNSLLSEQLFKVPILNRVPATKKREISYLWTQAHDSRNYLVIGDPAVRLNALKG